MHDWCRSKFRFFSSSTDVHLWFENFNFLFTVKLLFGPFRIESFYHVTKYLLPQVLLMFMLRKKEAKQKQSLKFVDKKTTRTIDFNETFIVFVCARFFSRRSALFRVMLWFEMSPSRHLTRNFMVAQKMEKKQNETDSEEKNINWMTWIKVEMLYKKRSHRKYKHGKD